MILDASALQKNPALYIFMEVLSFMPRSLMFNGPYHVPSYNFDGFGAERRLFRIKIFLYISLVPYILAFLYWHPAEAASSVQISSLDR